MNGVLLLAGGLLFAPPLQAGPPPPCDDAVEAAVRRAEAGDLDGATRVLEHARPGCPDHPGLLRELAALRFRQGHGAEAEATVRALLAVEPTSDFGWDLLATLRYLDDDGAGALGAWNRIGRPRVTGTPDPRWGIAAGELLTPAGLRRAERRLEALPSVARARVDWRPAEGGTARIEAALAGHPDHTLSRAHLPAHGVRAAAGLVEVHATDRAGAGERIGLGAAFDRFHREVEGRIDLPVPRDRGASMGLAVRHAVTRVDGDRVERTGVRAMFTPWPGARLHGSTWGGIDRWPRRGTHGGLGAAVGFIAAPGLGFDLEGARWSGGFGMGAASVRVAAPAGDFPREQLGPGWSIRARGGWIGVSEGAPGDLLPRFGDRRSSTYPMRAGGESRPPGNSWLHGGAELIRGRSGPWGVTVGAAAFVDAVRATDSTGLDGGPSTAPDPRPRGAVHVGVGLRLGLPGVDGWLRADGAVDPARGTSRLSLGWAYQRAPGQFGARTPGPP